jgi:hypothetical protein
MVAGMTAGAVLLLSRRRRFLDPLIETLSATGLDVVVAETASDGADAWSTVTPLGAIVDLLSVSAPVDACATIRDLPAAAGIPILFVGSGAEEVRSTNDAVFVGGDAYFQLPVETARIVAKVAAYVGIPSSHAASEMLLGDPDGRPPPPLVVPPAALPDDLLGDDADDGNDAIDDGADGQVSAFDQPIDARRDDAVDDDSARTVSALRRTSEHDDEAAGPSMPSPPLERPWIAYESGRFDAVDALAREAHDAMATQPRTTLAELVPAEGLFFDGELPGLLWAAWSQGVTGAVEVRHFDGRTRTLGLEKGEPVWLHSVLDEDLPPNILVMHGFLTLSQRANLQGLSSPSARRLCTALVADGLLKLEELVPAARAILLEQLRALMSWPEGSFRFLRAPTNDADRVCLDDGFASIMVSEVRHLFEEGRLWSVLGGPMTLVRLAEPCVLPAPLVDEERAVLTAIDGTCSVADVVFGSRCAPIVALQALFVGVTVGAVVVVSRGSPRSADDAAWRQRRAQQIDRARIVNKLTLARDADLPRFLGLASHASVTEMRRAVALIRERFNPAHYVDAAFADLLPGIAEILERADRAETEFIAGR